MLELVYLLDTWIVLFGLIYNFHVTIICVNFCVESLVLGVKPDDKVLEVLAVDGVSDDVVVHGNVVAVFGCGFTARDCELGIGNSFFNYFLERVQRSAILAVNVKVRFVRIFINNLVCADVFFSYF